MSYEVSPCEQLHRYFNTLERFDWTSIRKVPSENGVYIVFEKGEQYGGMDRVVRVGTHNAQGRLKNRLKDHFIRENKDSSAFRKNVGKAILNKREDPYLHAWGIKTSMARNMDIFDSEIQGSIEREVSAYIRENCNFAVLQVVDAEERLRYEKGIIAALNRDTCFGPSDQWLGRFSPELEIKESGLWLKDGLTSEPLSEDELMSILNRTPNP